VPGYQRGDKDPVDGQPGGPGPSGKAGPGPGGTQANWYGSSAEGAAGRGPVRGYPPTPGQPPPLYPPGQFAAWNRRSQSVAAPPAVRTPAQVAAGPLASGPGGGDAGRWSAASDGAAIADEPGAAQPRGYYGNGEGPDGDPGYSVLAVSDPAADVTSTQTWRPVADGRATGTWTMPPAPGRHQIGPGTAAQGTRPAAPPLPKREPGGRRRGAAGDDGAAARAGVVRDGASQDRASHDSTVRDRASRDSTVRDRASRDSIVRDGASPAAAAASGPAASRTGAHAALQPGARRTGSAGADVTQNPAAPPAERQGRARSGAHTGPYSVPRKRRHPWSVKAAIGGALVLVLAAAAALYLGVLRSPAKSHPTAQPGKSAAAPSAAPSATPSLGPNGHIGTRGEDPAPLTVAQLYPATFTAYGGVVTRVADKVGSDCSAAIAGASLQSAVSSGGCNQVVRATYITRRKGMMATIGVLNLKSASAAKTAASTAGASDFIDQVPAHKGPTTKIGQGTGIEEAAAKGHYLILIWAEFIDLRKPKTTEQSAELDHFMSVLLDNTANLDLTTRFLTGKP
jgi:hypothetical protein